MQPNQMKALLVLVLLGSWGGDPALGEDVAEFTARITAELEERNPEAASLFVEANLARESSEFARAEALYREVLHLEPDYYHAMRRLCSVVLALGRRGEGIALCRDALTVADTAENHSALVVAILDPEHDRALTPSEIDELLVHARWLVSDPQSDPDYLPVVCAAAVKGDDLDLLRRAVARLESSRPGDVSTYYFAWLLAVVEGDLDRAMAALETARSVGLPEDQFAELMATTDEARPLLSRFLPVGAKVGAAWLAGLMLLLLLGGGLSRLALRAARRLPTVRSGESAGLHAVLRRSYQGLLWVCCAYYYVSVPLVLIAVIALGGGLIYGFLTIGRIPLKLLVIVIVVMAVTLWAALKSLFIRRQEEDPGQPLDCSTEPRLRGVLDEVAGQLDTRPVDNVYLTPGADVAVMERGGMLRQLRHDSERCLILGVGGLEGMKLGDLKAVLAHEYGHFSNKDTAGGGFALAVRRSLGTMALGLAEGGAAVWYNPAWLFLRGFDRIFLVISQGASRLQEVLADRWAAFAYGAGAFERGLRHVIERSIRFGHHAGTTLKEVVDGGKPLANLYSYRPSDKPNEADISAELSRAIHAEPSPYDSHPSPADRFAWVRALGAEGCCGAADANEDAWCLFSDRGEIERRMTELIRANVELSHGIQIRGDACAAPARADTM